ncbi:MAG TPA: 50S ribosomal protein L4 [Candidatus Polarisedimenticolia bacterium]|jgi:large subunit ribosomal protein L4|nr:50S ribosomal protein L4 [Candidatus Polarisedimenticolia bacterium]
MDALKVVNLQNEKVGELALEDAVFGYPLKRHLIFEAVNAYRTAGRSGTRQTKTRAEVSGSGRKLWKQKKTGRARVGSIRSSIWRHGGTVFGPHPHDYENSLPKQMRRNAVRSVLSSKLRGDKVRLVENLDLSSPKTKEMTRLLEALELTGKVLFVDREVGRNLELAARNLQKVGVSRASSLSVVELLHHDTLVLTRSAAESLAEIYAS